MSIKNRPFREDPHPSPAMNDGYLRLAAAVLADAAEQVRSETDLDAYAWLRDTSGTAPIFADAIGLDYQAVNRWAAEVDVLRGGKRGRVKQRLNAQPV